MFPSAVYENGYCQVWWISCTRSWEVVCSVDPLSSWQVQPTLAGFRICCWLSHQNYTELDEAYQENDNRLFQVNMNEMKSAKQQGPICFFGIIGPRPHWLVSNIQFLRSKADGRKSSWTTKEIKIDDFVNGTMKLKVGISSESVFCPNLSQGAKNQSQGVQKFIQLLLKKAVENMNTLLVTNISHPKSLLSRWFSFSPGQIC